MPQFSPDSRVSRSGVTRRMLLGMTLAAASSLAIGARAGATEDPSTPPNRPAHASQTRSELLRLLAMTPPSVLIQEEGMAAQPMFAYVDVRAQLATLGVKPYEGAGSDLPEGFFNALNVVPVETEPYRFALSEEFIDLFGFSAFSAERTMLVGSARRQAIFLQGGIDLEALPRHWEAAGYRRNTTATGQEAWTNGENGEFSPDDPAQRITIGRLNNALIMEDGTLVFTPRFDTLDAIATLAAGGGDSLAGTPGLAEALATLQDDTVAVMATAGEDLSAGRMVLRDAPVPESLADADAEFGPLPAPQLLVMGLTAGVSATPAGEEPAHRGFVQSRLVMDSVDDTDLATEIVPQRWETLTSAISDRAYADLLAVRSAEPLETIAAVDLDIVGPPGAWKSMVWANDLLPYAFDPDAVG
ncbi:MAG: hypothetical protein WBA63_06810 [Thermomicrobiales bacterium]